MSAYNFSAWHLQIVKYARNKLINVTTVYALHYFLSALLSYQLNVCLVKAYEE